LPEPVPRRFDARGGLPAFRSIFVAFVFFCETEFVRRILCRLSCFCMKTSIKTQTMKKILCLAAGLLVLNLMPGFGQQSSSTFSERLKTIQNAPKEAEANAPALTKFTLDFPGGTPAELVKAIEKAMSKPLNVIIPGEYAATELPALKMNNVDVPQLFNAVINVSYRYGPQRPGYSREVISSYGFETKDSKLSNDSIWYFFVYRAEPAQKNCAFYSLAPFLDRGFTVDGWKMAGIAPVPELNYHKETKMLIAYGESNPLQMIQQVLQTLPASTTSRNEIDNMKFNIQQLQNQVISLQKKISTTPVPAVSPEEKTGK
jgi:hypothetical protein